jgi:hypothetical protein
MSDNESDSKFKTTNNNDQQNLDEVSPGAAYLSFVEMETLSNKLKLLNYEGEYLIRWRMKPLSK